MMHFLHSHTEVGPYLLAINGVITPYKYGFMTPVTDLCSPVSTGSYTVTPFRTGEGAHIQKGVGGLQAMKSRLVVGTLLVACDNCKVFYVSKKHIYIYIHTHLHIIVILYLNLYLVI